MLDRKGRTPQPRETRIGACHLWSAPRRVGFGLARCHCLVGGMPSHRCVTWPAVRDVGPVCGDICGGITWPSSPQECNPEESDQVRLQLLECGMLDLVWAALGAITELLEETQEITKEDRCRCLEQRELRYTIEAIQQNTAAPELTGPGHKVLDQIAYEMGLTKQKSESLDNNK